VARRAAAHVMAHEREQINETIPFYTFTKSIVNVVAIVGSTISSICSQYNSKSHIPDGGKHMGIIYITLW
jgi:hypothetical protein